MIASTCLTLPFSEELGKEWFEMWPSANHKVMRSIKGCGFIQPPTGPSNSRGLSAIQILLGTYFDDWYPKVNIQIFRPWEETFKQ